ncbi:MAG: adenosylmethionine--8-amino-7-oxononanoate transaminase [Myxococcota bacterium]|nr:adenosylmethionine--8-amino-7-oxononanoate transaminase [Myxococcota bacterium]
MMRNEFRDKVSTDWLAVDRRHVWHPYASIVDPLPTVPVVAATGVRLILEDGQELIDGMASWWAAIHGYNHPVLNQAIAQQMCQMSHVMFGGLTHKPAVELAALLLDIAPEPLEHVFLVDSGSVAVEVALKMAIQYWQAAGHPKKQKMLTFKGGYHGDTMGAMSICDPVNGMHTLFSHVLAKHYFAPAPTCQRDEDWQDRDIAPFRRLIETHRHELAAVVVEPLVQGAGGMRFYCPEYLRQIRALCDANGVLLILDEIATGFGRLGAMFACEKASIAPDILCLGKALTGGTLSLAATLTTPEVAQTICKKDPGVFMHGPTYMGNPLACAAAKASTELLLASPYGKRVAGIERHFKQTLLPLGEVPGVRDARVQGAIGVIELETAIDMARIQPEFVRRGVWVRPFRNLIYLMPPYIIEPPDLEKLTTAVADIVALSSNAR